YELYWNRNRPRVGKVVDAHSLYLETLAELGPIGLALLAAAFVVPLAVFRRARANPLAAVALGGFLAYLVHAAVDWDWEITAVTLPALFCGVALVASAESAGRARRLVGRGRALALAGTALLIGATVYALAGRIAIERSASAAQAGRW